MDTGADLSFPEGLDINNSIFGLILSNNLSHNLYTFKRESVYSGKKFLIKNSMCRIENNIFLYIVYKVITIVLIFNKYHQFRIWCKFIDTNFTRDNIQTPQPKTQKCNIIQEDLLRCFPFEMPNRCVIIYMSYSCNCKLLPGIQQAFFKLH